MYKIFLVPLLGLSVVVGNIFYKKNNNLNTTETAVKKDEINTTNNKLTKAPVAPVSSSVVYNNTNKKIISSKEEYNEKIHNYSENENNNTDIINKTIIKKNRWYNRFYTKANVYIGYGYQNYNSSFNNGNNITSDTGIVLNKIESIYGKGTNSLNSISETISARHSVLFGTGYNIYFKAWNRLHPFIGVDFTGRVPVQSAKHSAVGGMYYLYSERGAGIYIDQTHDAEVVSENKTKGIEHNIVFQEYLKLNAKLGMKIILHKNFAVEPYALAGINVARIDYSVRDRVYAGDYNSFITVNGEKMFDNPKTSESFTYRMNGNNKKISIGTVFGGGLNFIFKERFTLGFEYYRSVNKIDTSFNLFSSGGYSNTSVGTAKSKMVVDVFLLKSGIQF